jgi:hypothetical protein
VLGVGVLHIHLCQNLHPPLHREPDGVLQCTALGVGF